MKKILLSIAILLVAFSVNAQIFTLTSDDVALGDTITIFPEDETATSIPFYALLHNNSDNNINVAVARTRVTMIGDASDYFCWGACYPPFTDTSSVNILVNAGSTSPAGDDGFVAHYDIHDAVGISVVKYRFYNVDNHDEFVEVVVKYNTAPDGISEHILSKIEISSAYPNPASNYVDIDYNLPAEVESASIKVMSLLGSVVKESNITDSMGKLRLNVSDLNSGVYFYSVVINSEVIRTEKLIVR